MKTSQKGIDLIKNFEGCRLAAYKPVAGEQYWTIGWGHYGPDVTQGMTITQDMADNLLVSDLVKYENEVERIAGYLNLNQNQFDALVSFTYNCGSGNLKKLTKNQTRTAKEIAEHIEAYNKGASGVLPGLVKRRKAEKELFLTPDPNKERLDFLGVTRWHECGITGKGISFTSRETLSTHGKKVYEVMKLIAPDADLNYGKNYTKDIDENVDVYTTSYFQSCDEYQTNKSKARELFLKDVFLVCAAGNDQDGTTELSKDEWWTSIGACNLVNRKPVRMTYSGTGNELDFMSFTNFETVYGTFTGTSCAAPVFAGLCVLVQQFFKDKIGRKLTNFELLDFIKDNCLDLQQQGFDDLTGWGLFGLPDPEDIDVSKYEEEIEVRYQTIDDIPSWGKETIQKLVDKEILKGNENGLDLSADMLRMLVILDRAKTFDK